MVQDKANNHAFEIWCIKEGDVLKKVQMAACPHCGAEIPSDSRCCPNCGSDDRTGWSEQTYLDGLGLPDDDEYEELKQNEFSEKTHKKNWWITITGLVVLIIFILMIFLNM